MKAGSKRVFVLGAGFSKAAGLPLATELTDLIAQQLSAKFSKDDEINEFIEHVLQLHRRLNRRTGLDKLSVEELYEYAFTCIERFKGEQHRLTLGRDAGMTPYSTAKSIGIWLSYIDRFLLEI